MNKRGKSLFLIFGIILFLLILLFTIMIYAASFSDISQSNFNNGTYANTSYNGSAVVLVGSNLSGTFASRVFDAVSVSSWDNFSASFNIPAKEYIYAVDNQADVWNSSDSAVTWNLVKDDYNNGDGNGVTTSFFNKSGSYFIIFNQDVWRSKNSGRNWSKVTTDFNGGNGNIFGLVVNNSNTLIAADAAADIWISVNQGVNWTLIKDDYNGAAGNNVDDMAIDSSNNLYLLDVQDVWKSSDSGVTWSKVNDDFNGAGDAQAGQAITIDSQGNVYVVDGGEDVFKSTDGGATFIKTIADLNTASNGAVSTITSILKTANVTFQVKTCSLSNCSDGNFVGPGNSTDTFFTNSFNNLSSLNLTGRYFQYKVYLTREDSGIAPQLYNVSIESIIINRAPSVMILSPSNNIKFTSNISLSLNFSVSDIDNNLGSCWYNIDGDTNKTLSNCQNSSFNVSQGNHTIRLYANDTLGEINSSSVFFSVDSINPRVSVNYPTNNSYNLVQTLLNYTASDSNLQSCWYSTDNGITNTTITCGQNASGLTSSQGSNIWKVYTNDTFGNINTSSVTFSVDSISPSISIIYPSQGAAFGFNTSINLNYSVLDSNLQSCWFNIDNALNKTISNCQNTTFNTSEGSHTLNVYSNDSYGNLGSSSANFSVAVGAPSISLNSPGVDAYLNYTLVTFNYTATDIDLQACELWGNFTGSFIMNKTNSTLISGQQSSFSLNLLDGNYIWNIMCNDTQGNSAFNGNRSLNIDTTSPSVTISEPTGTKTSIIGIPLTFSISDVSPTVCVYNVSFSSTGNTVIGNTKISNCSSTSFDVDSESSYTLYLKINDSAGNSRTSSSNFSVSGSSSGGGSGSSGGSSGGGGGSSFGLVPLTTLKGKLEIESLSNIIINPGESKRLTLNVKNSGLSFLNSCRLIGSGNYSSWIESSESRKLGGGESADFIFTIKAPNDAKSGKYNIIINVECSETKEITNFDAEIIEQKLAFNILDVKREQENSVRVRYSIEEASGLSQNVEMQFLLFNSDNRKIAEIKDSKTIAENSVAEFEVLMPIDPSLKGDFNLLVNINSETYSTFVQESVVLSAPVSGFALFQRDAGTDNIIAGVIIVLFLIFAFFMVGRIMRLKRQAVKTRDFR